MTDEEMGTKTVSSINGLVKTGPHENWTTTIPYTQVNSKCFKGLNVRHEIIKLVGENTDNRLFDISLSIIFLDNSLQARATKTKIN